MRGPSAHGRHGPGQGRTAAAASIGANLTRPGARRALALIAGAAALLLVAVLLFVPLGGTPPASSPGTSGPVVIGGSPLLDKPAPPIDLLDLDGQRVTLADYAGHPVIVNIWASWCIPCREEFPMLIGAYGEYRDQGLEVLGIVHDDAAASAGAFARDQGATWPMLMDVDDVVWRDYIGLGVPQSYFIDADGIVRAFTIGPFSAAGLEAGLAKIMPPRPTGS